MKKQAVAKYPSTAEVLGTPKGCEVVANYRWMLAKLRAIAPAWRLSGIKAQQARCLAPHRGAHRQGAGPPARLRSPRYATPAAACGLPATLHHYPDLVKIATVAGRHEARHSHMPLVGTLSYLGGLTNGKAAPRVRRPPPASLAGGRR